MTSAPLRVPRWHVCLSSLSAALVLALTACSEKSKSTANVGGQRHLGNTVPTPVLVGQVQRKIVPVVIDAIGTVEPIRSAAVRAQVTGTLVKIAIREGQDVSAGDLLLEIDSRPFEAALRSALADDQRTQVQRDSARAQLARYQGLHVGAMVSQDQFQQIEDNARALEAQAAAASAAAATARLQLEYCSIRAPIAGRTGNLNVHEGDLIRANDTDPLVTINQLNPIYVTFGIAQQQFPRLMRYRSEGMVTVQAFPNAGSEHPATGELTFVDNTVDPTTGTIKLKATFPNADGQLWPGQFSTVLVTLASPEVLTVPASALQYDQAGQHVFVIKNDQTAEFRSVSVERTFEDDAVVTGVAAGETVVTDGQLRVIPGQPVQIRANAVLNPEGATEVVEQGAASRGKRGT